MPQDETLPTPGPDEASAGAVCGGDVASDRPQQFHGLERYTWEQNPSERRWTCFRHANMRVMERYGLELPRRTWETWNRKILAAEFPHALRLADGYGTAAIWRVWLDGMPVLAVQDHGVVVTVLPDRGQFRQAERKAARVAVWEGIRQEQARRQEALEARQRQFARTGEARRPEFPPLPPTYARPRRDEAALMRLRAAGTGRGRG